MADGVNSTPIYQKSLPANARRISIPAAALGPWLAEIDDLTELKVSLRTVALLAEGTNRHGVPPSVSLDDLLDDTFLARGCDDASIRRGLAAALEQRTLLAALDRGKAHIFLNDDAGRRHLEHAALPPLSPSDILNGLTESAPIPQMPKTQPDLGRANIFSLYEKHIDPAYRHSIAEQLKAAEAEYPLSWIEDAIAVALERNATSWNYVHAILRGWLREGRYTGSTGTARRQQDQHHEHGKPGDDTAPDSRTGYLESYRRRHGRLPWESGEPNSG